MTRELLVAALAREIKTLLRNNNGQASDDPALIARKEELLTKLVVALLEERDGVKPGRGLGDCRDGAKL